MRIVIFAALVVASMGACPDAFTDAMLTTGYAYGVAKVDQSTCVAAESKYTAAKITMKTKADIGKPTADGAAAGIECATGYTKATAGIKFGAADKDCALTGCTVTPTTAPKKMCDAKSNAAVKDEYAAFEAPKCESGRSTKTTPCTKAKSTGAFSWSCNDGTWTKNGACADAVWVDGDMSTCTLAKKGAVTEGAKVSAVCSTGTAGDCPADSKPADKTCTKSATSDDPKCTAAMVKAKNDAKSTCSKEEETAVGGTIAGVGSKSGITYTCTLMNNPSADGVLAGFVASGGPKSTPALTCGETAAGGGGDGSSAGTLSTFVALVAAVAYMW